MEGRGREASKPVGNRFLAIFVSTIGDDRLVSTSRFGPILIGNKDGKRSSYFQVGEIVRKFLKGRSR